MSTLDDWVRALSAELGVDETVDIRGLLDVARDAAHGVDRPAAPLTTFLVGYAAAQAGGGPAAVEAALARTTTLVREWAGTHPQPDRAPS